ncbi:unnamed protein product [Rotaria magnacalcarata]|uniref:Uncharacterized protein n=1 Tax=Rotaria magnacalcarata TaxID=392030 RepID=A0A8S2L397_9BILA|nr:unnamed protein product [Rotaria magnacalcarata]
MGKRGRPPKKKPIDTAAKVDECYTILSSDEETGSKPETLSLPSPSQRRGMGNERNGTIVITPPNRSILSTKNVEKNAPLTRNNNNNKKKLILNGKNKKSDSSGDSDATEVYV